MKERETYRKALNEKIKALSEEYRQCMDPLKKEELKNQLRELLTEQFNNTSSDIKNQLELQERRLYEIRKIYEKHTADPSKQVEARLKKLTTVKKTKEKKENITEK